MSFNANRGHPRARVHIMPICLSAFPKARSGVANVNLICVSRIEPIRVRLPRMMSNPFMQRNYDRSGKSYAQTDSGSRGN
jgi:hypothetical protein